MGKEVQKSEAKQGRISNGELAEAYLTIRLMNATVGLSSFITQKRLIAAAPIDIQAKYLEEGNLSKARIPGIGVKTGKIVEEILKYGQEEAARRVRDKMSGDQFKGVESGRIKLRCDDEEKIRFPGSND
jgi:hypothetical protein